MKIALVGNPNSGKTTLFNSLTELNQKTGNWAGVTVGIKKGNYIKDKNIEIIDLPGIYSLYPYSQEEAVTSKYLSERDFDAVINIIDSTNLERNLNLTLQVLELGLPTVLALNMEDELHKRGLTLNTNNISQQLCADVVQISALKNKNIDLLIEKTKKAISTPIKNRYKSIGINEEEKATNRQKYIEGQIASFRIKSNSEKISLTDKIDNIVTNKWLAYPIFAFIIWLMYFVSVQTVGAIFINATSWFFNDFIGESIRVSLTNANIATWLTGLIVDGIIAGVGAVLSFVPQIVVLFLFIILLEASGYMARVAFIMDRIFKKLGLSGKSFIPMIVGCGCTVPAIMSTKTIEGTAERRQTIMLTPFIPCSAKLPVFALIAGALFPNNSFVAPSMYFLGIFMVIICGLIMNGFRKRIENKYLPTEYELQNCDKDKRLLLKKCPKSRSSGIAKSADTFIIEMPAYRFPKFKSVLLELWDKARDFFVRAGTIIFVASIVIWFLQNFSFGFVQVSTQDSMLAGIGKFIAPLFVPLGFGNWQASVALISGMFAKETVVSTLNILFSSSTDLTIALNELFTPQAAYAFMAFVLLSAPCVASISATRKEMGSSKWMWIAITFQTVVAYITALIINQVGNLWQNNSTLLFTIILNIVILIILYLCIRYLTKKKSACDGCKGCH